MIISLDIVISTIIGLVAILVAIISLIEVRKQVQQSKEQSEKRTKLLETIAKALPYTMRESRPKSSTNKKFDSGLALSQTKSENIKQMKLDLENEKLR